MTDHFKDDHESFDKIDKAFERQNELAKLSSEHFSYFNKTLLEIQRTQEKEAEKNAKFMSDFIKHTERVEPAIKAYEDSQVIKKNNEEMGEKIVKWSARVTAVSIIGGFIGGTIIYIISFIKKTL